MQEMRQLPPVSLAQLAHCDYYYHTLHYSVIQADPEKPVLVAGDPERAHEVKVVADGGIWYHNNLIAALVSYISRIAYSV